jgi:hypothetical protein
MGLALPPACQHLRFGDRLAETGCRFLGDRDKVRALLDLGFDVGSFPAASLVVASGRLGVHVLFRSGPVDCSPIQVKSKDQTLVASLAAMAPTSENAQTAFVEFEAEGCVGVVAGTIEARKLPESRLQALLDAAGDP